MSTLRALRPSLPILVGASVMLSLAMGLRQSLGLFMPPLTRDTGLSVGDFTLAWQGGYAWLRRAPPARLSAG